MLLLVFVICQINQITPVGDKCLRYATSQVKSTIERPTNYDASSFRSTGSPTRSAGNRARLLPKGIEPRHQLVKSIKF